MKEKQKGIDPLNIFVICIGIMVLVTAIINGCIKANAEGLKSVISRQGNPNVYSASDNGYWYRDIRANIVGNRVCAYRYNAVEKTDTLGTNYVEYSYRIYSDYGSIYSTNVMRTDYIKHVGEAEFSSTDNSFEMTINPRLVETDYNVNVYIHDIGLGNTSLTGVPMFEDVNSCIEYIVNGNEEGNVNRQPQNIEDNNIPAPRGMYVANNSLYDHFENQIQLTNYNTQYYVGYALRTTIPVQLVDTKVSGNRHRITWSNVFKTDYMNKYSIADVKNYGEGFVPQDGKVNLYENKNKITNETDTYTEYVKNKILELNQTYMENAGYYTGLAYTKMQMLNGGWVGNEVLMYYYYVDNVGDTHIGPATAFNMSLPDSVDFDFAGVLKSMNNQQVTYTTDLTLSEKEEMQESNNPIYNDTTQTGSNTGGSIGNIDTDDVGISVETVRKTIEQLIDFTGDVPQFFGRIFTFFPQWLLNLIYIGMGLGVIVGIIKIIRG